MLDVIMMSILFVALYAGAGIISLMVFGVFADAILLVKEVNDIPYIQIGNIRITIKVMILLIITLWPIFIPLIPISFFGFISFKVFSFFKGLVNELIKINRLEN